MFVPEEVQTKQDWKAIAAYMERAGFPLNPKAEIRQFESGLANLNYLIELADGRKVVFRRPPAGPLPPGAYNLAREFNIYHTLGDLLSFVPKGLVLCDDVDVIGVPFFVMEFCQGSSLGRNLPASLSQVPMIGDKLSSLVIEALADLHKLNPSTIGLQELGKAEGFLGRQIGGWKKRGGLVFSSSQNKEMDSIVQWLEHNEPKNPPTALVHHDFKLDNLLVDTENLVITGVIDWEMATIGDPWFDLALTLAVWGEEKDTNPYRNLCMMPCEAEGWWSRSKALQVYSDRTGLSVSEGDWKFYWILALLRMAVVFAQLAALYTRHPNMAEKANAKLHISPTKFSAFSTKILQRAKLLIQQKEIDF